MSTKCYWKWFRSIINQLLYDLIDGLRHSILCNPDIKPESFLHFLHTEDFGIWVDVEMYEQNV
mgnify:CR=1 FL=1